jgi:putative solute:sodium symporter small subunit
MSHAAFALASLDAPFRECRDRALRVPAAARNDLGFQGGNATVNDTERQNTYWRRTSGLMWLMLFLWFLFSFIVHWAVKGLNTITILDFPLGFYMAAQGSLIAFVVILFWFAWRQDAIDRDTGMAEDE